ncbi:hypothetical protein QJQ45_007427 [Haematococcus lacustris]|nr:hypothetical protein QJQ45_007427 [Haematococcus lacustris]
MTTGECSGSASAALGAQATPPSLEQDKAAQSETKQVEAGGIGAEPVDAEELLKAFFGELKDVDRDNEVNRILWAFKLNPFEKLNLRFDAPIEDVRKQYRKLSLMVHPDKCKHPQATAAFDLLGEAQKELMNDEKREHLLAVLNMAKEDVLKAWRKETKHDNLVRVASFLNDAGKEGVQAAWEKTDEFHERWRLKGRELLASAEWRKRRLGKRMKEETARLEGVAAESRDKAKKTKAVEKEWEATREQRVGTWREFMADASKSGKTVGELKPPKLRANDEDKLYVRRPVKEEELRPAPPPSRMQNNAPKPRAPPPI